MSFGHARDLAEPSASEIDLSQIVDALSRKRRFVIGSTLAALIVALVFVNVVKPRYTAEARVLLENQENYLTRADKGERMESATAPDAEAVQSQIQLLTSRDLARRAIKALGLQGNREFDPLADGLGTLSRVGVMLGLVRDPTKLAPEERILDSYYERLAVLSPTKTRVLLIEFSSRDPDLAARAANTIASLYIDIQQEAKRENARAAAQSLSKLVADLRTRVAQAEGRVEDFRMRSGLLAGTNNMTIATQQLGDLTNQLSLSRTAKADAEAKAKLVREMLQQNRVGEIPDVANNELIRRIGEQRVTLRGQLALESRTLLPGHPRIKELSAQLADLDADLRRAAERTARTLENEARIASSRVANLERVTDEQKRIAGEAGADEVQLRELERAARVLKDQLEADSAKYQEALARESVKTSPADARIIQRAVAPQSPSFPKKLPITAFATIAALVLSCGAIVSIELLSGRPRASSTRVLPSTDVEAIAPQPRPRRRIVETERKSLPSSEGASPAEAVDDSPPSALEAGAGGEPAALLEDGSEPRVSSSVVGRIDAARMSSLSVKVLLIGCLDAEKNVGTAVELARSLARRGRAIIVAADADEAAYDRLVPSDGFARPLGLADLAGGATTFADAIHRDIDSRLHVMPGGRAEGAPEQDAQSVLDALAQTYDFVVFATRSYERALFLAPSFDMVLVVGGDAAAEVVRDDIEHAGVANVFILDNENGFADDLFAA